MSTLSVGGLSRVGTIDVDDRGAFSPDVHDGPCATVGCYGFSVNHVAWDVHEVTCLELNRCAAARVENREAQEVEEVRLTKRSDDLENVLLAEGGVYVFTFPHYLRHPQFCSEQVPDIGAAQARARPLDHVVDAGPDS